MQRKRLHRINQALLVCVGIHLPKVAWLLASCTLSTKLRGADNALNEGVWDGCVPLSWLEDARDSGNGPLIP